MRVIVKGTFAEACVAVAEIIGDLVRRKPTAKLGLATGSTPEGVYDHLAEMCAAGLDFSGVTTVNLDEYRGITGDNPVSYRYFMDKMLFSRINIDPNNTYVASGVKDLEEELARFKRKIYDGQIDLQLLGIGVNGHVGFNEPAEKLYCTAHVEKLTPSTIAANARFFAHESEVPTEALTMGIGDIMSAAAIVLLAGGANKATAIRELITNDFITTAIPATFIKAHSNATVVIDRELAELAGYR